MNPVSTVVGCFVSFHQRPSRLGIILTEDTSHHLMKEHCTLTHCHTSSVKTIKCTMSSWGVYWERLGYYWILLGYYWDTIRVLLGY